MIEYLYKGIAILAEDGEAITENNNETIVIVFAVVFVLAVAALIVFKNYSRFQQWAAGIITAIGALLSGSLASNAEVDALNQTIQDTGYTYDAKQDIFYSSIDAWQRDYGYCRLYDEAAPPLGMIIDCEPVTFEYDEKRWLIEFWKGQYDLTTGCEVGIYVTNKPDINIPGVFSGPFYDCVGDDDLFPISFALIKNQKTLMQRDEKHWWLTGFMLGEFSNPGELSMEISITLKDEEMCSAFVAALTDIGYTDNGIKQKGHTVSVTFDQPQTVQPSTRTKEIDFMMQWKNRYLCERYKEMTKAYPTMPEKLEAVKAQAPQTYQMIMDMGKSTQVFKQFGRLQNE